MYTEEDFKHLENITQDIPLLEEIKAFLKTLHGNMPIELHNQIRDGNIRRRYIANLVNDYKCKKITKHKYQIQMLQYLCSCYYKSINEMLHSLADQYPEMLIGYEPKPIKIIRDLQREQTEKKQKHRYACQKGQYNSAQKKRELKEQVKSIYMSINDIENMHLKIAHYKLTSKYKEKYNMPIRREISTLYKWMGEFKEEKKQLQNLSQTNME